MLPACGDLVPLGLMLGWHMCSCDPQNNGKCTSTNCPTKIMGKNLPKNIVRYNFKAIANKIIILSVGCHAH